MTKNDNYRSHQHLRFQNLVNEITPNGDRSCPDRPMWPTNPHTLESRLGVVQHLDALKAQTLGLRQR